MKKLGFIVGGAILIFMIVASALIMNRPPVEKVTLVRYSAEDVVNMSYGINFDLYDPETILGPNNDNGGLDEKIKGDKNAPVIIFEYADYACSHCAEMNTEINRIYNDYNGKVAIVFRNYLLGYSNGLEIAAAANAAYRQGYWENFKNTVFEEQAVWYDMKPKELKDYISQTFAEASNGKGDIDRLFIEMSSNDVIQKIAFDHSAGDFVGLTGTPHFRINGEQVKSSELRKKIDEILASKGL